MTLSVVIVSYNVKYFLEQCLCSIQRAADNGVEVFVVDNNSTDGTVEYLQQRYPFVQFISNKENTGFARANNQVLHLARGKYILFLNPDTIIPDDLFKNCLAFFEKQAEAGAVGVRMIDGSGAFLKESKRGFPSPWVAFCKMTGLTNLFPHSATFARYYMGHLPEKEINVVDALAGACLFVRKDVLDKIGGFDEQFFMYAEDIDLSYRVQKAGYKNYYFPQATIIHFKGESTRKDSRYVHLFYKAMIQFTRKHFGKNMVMEAAINFRAWLASRGAVQKPSNQLMADLEFFPVGDQISFSEIPVNKSRLPKDEYIVFCEGPGFSFNQIIEQLQEQPAGNRIFFHGYGTRSAVSSTDRTGQGEIFRW